MSETNMIGPIVTNYDVEKAFEKVINDRFGTYLRDMVRKRAQDPEDEYQDLRAVWCESGHGEEPQGQTPAVVIVSPGTTETHRHGRGDYTAKWRVGLVIMVTAKDRGSARRMAADYYGAMLAMLIQHASLDGFASALKWEGQMLDAQPRDASEHMGVAYMNFVVTVDDTVDASGLPNLADAVQTHPDDYDDPGPLPTAETIEIEITQEV